MKSGFLTALAAAITLATLAPRAGAHCQIPCGIYDDNNVIQTMHTDWLTIDKAVKTIPELMADPTNNANQVTRWITNKESHCQSIQDIVSRYFLAQRIKVPADATGEKTYQKQLALCHQVIVAAMKCKQSTDPKAVEALGALLRDFQETFGTKK